VMIKPIEKLRLNIKAFSNAYDFQGSLRTSNMIDRLILKQACF